MTLSGLLSGDIVHDCVEKSFDGEMGSLKSAIARPKRRAWNINHLASMTDVFSLCFSKIYSSDRVLIKIFFLPQKNKNLEQNWSFNFFKYLAEESVIEVSTEYFPSKTIGDFHPSG